MDSRTTVSPAASLRGEPESPKLGNFAKILNSSQLSSRNASPSSTRPLSLDNKPNKLGDFQKILHKLQASAHGDNPDANPTRATVNSPTHLLEEAVKRHSLSSLSPLRHFELLSYDAPTASHNAQSEYEAIDASVSVLKRAILAQHMQDTVAASTAAPVHISAPASGAGATSFSSSSDAEVSSESENDFEADGSVLTPASTPPDLRNKHASPRGPAATRAALPVQPTVFTSPIRMRDYPVVQKGVLFSYHLGKDGPSINVYAHLRAEEEKHRSLTMDLAQHRAMDTIMATKYPHVAAHGTHVFVDMSNIDIGFHNAIRTRYRLGDNAYFSPLPQLNLEYLTEVLVRGRDTVALAVSCSTVPGRPQPRYVQEMQKIGYHVDLRERKRVEDHSPQKSRSNHVRYVEDLVDETLQTRMAESVMEHFEEQGTIVLATGDAKPAQYSDGFFMYVERALRMGWNIEVVSWKSSLSSTWTNKKWKTQWGDRFRVIELDGFLDSLICNNV